MQQFFFKKCQVYKNMDSISAHFLLDVQNKSSFKHGLPELANEWSFIVTGLIVPILQRHKVDHKTIFHLKSYRVPVVRLAHVPVRVIDSRIVSPNPDPFSQLVSPTQPRPLLYTI
jgi:hypothetical protein